MLIASNPYIPKRSEVVFESGLTWAQVGQCAKSRKRFRDRLGFLEYRDEFEQCFVKTELLSGRCGVLEEYPILPPPNQPSISKVMGRNKWAEERVKYGPELFAWYRKKGDFWTNVKRTRYWKSLSSRGTPDVIIRSKINKCIKMYNRSVKYKNFAPAGSRWTSSDIPQVIDYYGYQKNMDGAHRRMVAYALGLRTMPCLVIHFDDLTQASFKRTLPFLRNNWEWFRSEVKRYADNV